MRRRRREPGGRRGGGSLPYDTFPSLLRGSWDRGGLPPWSASHLPPFFRAANWSIFVQCSRELERLRAALSRTGPRIPRFTASSPRQVQHIPSDPVRLLPDAETHALAWVSSEGKNADHPSRARDARAAGQATPPESGAGDSERPPRAAGEPQLHLEERCLNADHNHQGLDPGPRHGRKEAP